MDDAKTALREARKTTVQQQQQQQQTYGDDELMTDERENVAILSTVHGCVVSLLMFPPFRKNSNLRLVSRRFSEFSLLLLLLLM